MPHKMPESSIKARERDHSALISMTPVRDRDSKLGKSPFVAIAIIFHASWLMWSATWQSPTLNEPGQLAAGIANWSFLRFEPACVNPPLIRMIAAVPAILVGCKTEWGGLSVRNGDRCEGQIGSDFVRANGSRSQQLTVWGRWTLIPVSLTGAYFCWIWAGELYGQRSAFLALWVWCFEPNIVAHAQLITNDIPATTAGIAAAYTYSKWLQFRAFKQAIVAGFALGIALLTKFTWLILLPLWPVLWLITVSLKKPAVRPLQIDLLTLCLMYCVALFTLNSGYGWQRVFLPIEDFAFSSKAMNGMVRAIVDKQFIGELPVPVAADYLYGLDLQRKDFDSSAYDSYLAGEWQRGGWWYYYLYAAFVKLPIGVLTLFLVAVVRIPSWFRCGGRRPRLQTLACLCVPAVTLFVVASSHLAFNHHFRYVLPCLGPLIIFSSSAIIGLTSWRLCSICVCALAVSISSLQTAPNSLAYFNEFAGGPSGGHRHLLHSNLDWGQDLVGLKQWMDKRPDAKPFYIAYYGFFDPIDYGISANTAPLGPIKNHDPITNQIEPGWYAISANYLFGCEWGLRNRDAYAPFRKMSPIHRCGGSIYIFEVRTLLPNRIGDKLFSKQRDQHDFMGKSVSDGND